MFHTSRFSSFLTPRIEVKFLLPHCEYSNFVCACVHIYINMHTFARLESKGFICSFISLMNHRAIDVQIYLAYQ